MSDVRGRRIVIVAHCLLNQNAKVQGLASHPGVFRPIIDLMLKADVGIVQLACPEFVHLGPSRPLGTDTVEQYDTPEYRQVCLEIARRASKEAASYKRAGHDILCVLGVEGSPSCGVSRAPHLCGQDRSRLVPGQGLFIEALVEQFGAAGLEVPFSGIPESGEVGDLASALDGLRVHLQSR